MRASLGSNFFPAFSRFPGEFSEMESSFTFPRLNVNLVQLMERHCNSMTAITFDEVTLQDQPSDYHPNDVQMRSFITPKISLKVNSTCSWLTTTTVLILIRVVG